jgi:hypothetical protein
MAESTISVTYTQLRRIVGRAVGYDRDPSAWTSGKAYMATDVDDCIRSGLSRFYAEKDWGFLRMADLLVPLYAPYSTGTVTIVAGAVTGSGTTFPTWAADGDLVVDGLAHRVSTRGGNTALTLADTTVSATAGSSYSLVQARYTLPQSFSQFEENKLQYRPGDAPYTCIRETTIDDIRVKRFTSPDYNDYPQNYAIAAKSSTGSDGQRREMHFWPVPSADTKALGQYRIIPDMLVDTTLEYPYGGMFHSRAIVLACLAEAVVMGLVEDTADYEGRYQAQLAISKQRDAAEYSPSTVGFDIGTGPNFDFDFQEYPLPLRGLPDLTL